MQFENFDPAAFLAEYWQQKPLLIRNPWGQWANPLDGDELAGLACAPDIESRLIVRGAVDGWTLEHGPLTEDRFGALERERWTLLVQAVDHHVPQVAALIAPFRFVPNWRIDDVMVSYAVDGGGVGPHVDQYDVFLIQGLGRRRWRIGALPDPAAPAPEMVPHAELCLLAKFEPVAEWVLEPGDILYLPPGVAHDGVALGDDCMTYSIGFRAPARSELIAHWCDDRLAHVPADDRYADPGLLPQTNPGEISGAALARLQAMIAETLNDPAAFARWFGTYTTASKYPEVDWRPDAPISRADLRAAIAAGIPACRNPASRFSFVEQAAGVLLFVDGECSECTGDAAALARLLCAQDQTVIARALGGSDAVLALLEGLCNRGAIAFEAED